MNNDLKFNTVHNPKSDANVLEEVADVKTLILFNDDVNTFDVVIQSLIEICGFDQMQAEQCATIAHYNGKCPLMEGEHSALHPMYIALQNRKLTVEIS